MLRLDQAQQSTFGIRIGYHSACFDLVAIRENKPCGRAVVDLDVDNLAGSANLRAGRLGRRSHRRGQSPHTSRNVGR